MIVLPHAYMVVQFNRGAARLASGGAAEADPEKAGKDRDTRRIGGSHETGALAYIVI
jgi:hypothetical protein